MKIKFNSTRIKTGKEYIYEDEKILNSRDCVLPPNKEYTLVIDYPLDNPARFSFNSTPNGISRKRLVTKIRNYYKKVYGVVKNE
jgi:hypothetical protein